MIRLKKVKKALENREKKANPGKDIKDSSQISYADMQAKIMKHKGDFDYYYNDQVSVDSKSQIIVGQHLTQNENDKKEVEKALSEIEYNTGKVPDKMSLDNGYMTSGNISALEDAKVDAYIAAGKGEKDSLPGKIGKSNFLYDSGKDIFICPAGVVLKLKSSGENRVYKSEEMICGGCSYQTGGFRRFSLREFERAAGEFSIVYMVSNFKKIVIKIKSEINCIKEVELVPALS